MSRRYIQPLRILIQWGFLFFSLYLGIALYRFVQHFRTGASGAPPARPDGVEAFLPISALLSLKDWIVNGTINPVHPAALVIFLSVVAVSFLLKRSFCSWICPVGTISELLWKGGYAMFRRNLKPPRSLDLVLRSIKYLLLAFFLYSVLYLMAPQQLTAFIYSDYNMIADVRLMDFFFHPSGLSTAIIALLVLLSVGLRNPFCRFLCPYGALLGLVSLFSPVKATRNNDHCVSCGVCNQVCPSYILVMSKARVHSEECIGCLRCVSHCRAEGALAMKLTGRKITVNGLVFALLVVLFFWGGTMIGKMSGHWHTAIPAAEYGRLLGR